MKSLARTFGIIAIGLIIIFTATGCDNDSSSSPPPQTGIYLGIIGFDEVSARRDIGLLTTNNVSQFQNFIERLGPPHYTRRPYTELYNAVDTAINMLLNAHLPNDVEHFAIITFTDGLDNIAPERRAEINTRISTQRIHGFSIDAYAIGIQGQDVDPSELAAFLADLAIVASNSTDRYVRNVADMSEVDLEFTELANSLYWETQSQRIIARIPSAWPCGTRVRLTFDSVASAAGSSFFIEGTLEGQPNTNRPLVEKHYRGFGVNNEQTPAQVNGTHSGHRLSLTFDVVPIAGQDIIDEQNVQLWRWRDDFEFWQRESEFGDQVGDIVTTPHSASAAIMLVLDRSTSLDDDEFLQLQSAAKTFIDALLGGQKKDTQDIEHKNPPCLTS